MSDWRDDAACLGVDPELHFPGEGQNDVGRDAKRVCAGCPVRAECLEFAVSSREVLQGIWGGTTTKERTKLRKARRAGSAASARAGDRRADVLRLAGEGLGTSGIASQVGISRSYVKKIVAGASAPQKGTGHG